MLLLLSFGCSTIHGVKPVGKGNVEINASLGGPIVEVFSAPIPIPLTTVGATVGLTETLDVHAAFHPTAAMLMGIVEFDGGASYQFIAPRGAAPRLMGDLSLVGAGGNAAPGEPAGGFRLLLQPTVTGSWDWGRKKRQTVYTALTAFVEPAPTFHVIGAWAVGERWGLSPRLHLDTELKWIAPYQSSYYLVTHYYAPANLGAISFQLGLGYTFGKGS